MRDVVRHFAEEMEKQLAANEHKGGWEGEDPDFLLSELECHLSLLDDAVFERVDYGSQEALTSAILDNCADIANFALMVADVLGALPKEG